MVHEAVEEYLTRYKEMIDIGCEECFCMLDEDIDFNKGKALVMIKSATRLAFERLIEEAKSRFQ